MEIKNLIFWRVWIFQRISRCFVDLQVLRRLIWCWMKRILRDQNQLAFCWLRRIWLYWLPLISADYFKYQYLGRFFDFSNIHDSSERWNDIDIDASEMIRKITRLGRQCFGMTWFLIYWYFIFIFIPLTYSNHFQLYAIIFKEHLEINRPQKNENRYSWW